jgi:sRNA-binding regulator protein Hfq
MDEQPRENNLDIQGGVFNPGQQVEVNINGVWMPGQIQEVANFTVRNTETGRNINRPPSQVRPVNGGNLDTGENTNIIPGDRVEFQGSRPIYRHPGTLISKNYVVQIDGRTETVPHTRLRRAPEGQALQPEGPPPQPQGPPPQPEGPRLPQREYEQNQEIDALVNGEWRPGQIGGIENYTVLNTATGINITIAPENIRGQYRIGTRQRCNLRVYSPIEFRQGNRWFPGTINAINYLVNMVDNRGGLETVSQSNLRPRAGAQPPQPPNPERAEWRANVARWRAELARPAPAAAPQPAGVAFEVHNAFPELNFRKFMTIIRKDNNGASNFKDSTYPLQPLITYINNDKSTTIVDTVNERTKERIPEKTNLTRDLNGEIKIRLNMYLSEHPESKDNVMEMIQFVMSQGPDYKDPYIRFLAFDCLNAYGPGGASCTKGVFERVFLINKSVLMPLCSDDTSSASSSTSTCKEVYRELLGCFYPEMDINDIFGEWYHINSMEEGAISPLANASEEERKEDFRRFVLNKVPRADPTAINNYIQKNENTFKTLLIGGRRRKSRKLKKTIKKRKNGRKLKTIKKRR